MMADVRIMVPEMVGTRGAATELARGRVEDGDHVVVDFTGTQFAGQGFCDELVKQVLQVREGTRATFLDVPERSAKYVHRAIRLRGIGERAVFR